jgi:Cys-tRNA(Pro) deacylase
METDSGAPLIVLMHGDCEVSTKSLARTLGVKTVSPCDPAIAQKHTGYQVGGTSPFGTRKPLTVYAEKTIFELAMIYINGGKRGFLVAIHSNDLRRALTISEVNVKIGITTGSSSESVSQSERPSQ